jgi:F-type H+-transporting ATPase subunit alpha
VASLFVAVNGHLLDIKTAEVNRFVRAFLDYLKQRHQKLLDAVTETGAVDAEQEQELTKAVEDFKPLWRK